MDEKILLPDGGWALIRDPRRVTERKRRHVLQAHGRVMASELGGILTEKARREEAATVDEVVPPEAAKQIDAWATEELRKTMGDSDLTQQLDDTMIDAFVAEWSYEGAPSADAMLDLPSEVADVLKKACAPHLKALVVGFNPGDVNNETSPTEPSVD